MAQSGAVGTGNARFAALRTYGPNAENQPPLWETATFQLDVGSSFPDFFGAPAVAANGRIYIADTLGRVLRFNGTTPLMEGPWPTLGGGNRHAATPLAYNWNITSLASYYSSSGNSVTLESIDNGGRTVGLSTAQGYANTPSVWAPLYPTVLNMGGYAGGAVASDSQGNVIGYYGSGTSSRARFWLKGIYAPSVSPFTLPQPTAPAGYSTFTGWYATAIAENVGVGGTTANVGTVIGYALNSTQVAVVRWVFDITTGLWQAAVVTGPDSKLAYALAGGISGWAVGKTKFETTVGAPYRAFRLNPNSSTFNASTDDLGTLADVSSARSFTKASEALEIREGYGIVGRSQNADGVWRAFFITFDANATSNPMITETAALAGLLAPGSGTTWTSAAYALSRTGVSVGTTQISNPGGAGFVNRAVMWTGATGNPVTDLNTLLPANSGWVLLSATGVNDSGFIIGTGTQNGVAASFLLSPARNVN